ncbi:MAG: hypothetical protein AAF726_10760 [Planctomycetota bacterium]
MQYDDPIHPIIDRPHEYWIKELHYHMGLDGSEPYVDLELQKDSLVRRLRFWSPQQFVIEDGHFPHPTSGMVIYDVRKRHLGDLNVWVSDCEASHGSITFWARDVIDLDAEGES